MRRAFKRAPKSVTDSYLTGTPGQNDASFRRGGSGVREFSGIAHNNLNMEVSAKLAFILSSAMTQKPDPVLLYPLLKGSR
jgi:hypothetical protein